MVKVVVAAIFFLVVIPSFGRADIRQDDINPKRIIVKEEFRISYVKENLRDTLNRVYGLLEIKKTEQEQEALGEMRDILEEDIVFLRKGNPVTEYDLLELEWHHEAINTILDQVDRID